jgi:hypothetical protein
MLSIPGVKRLARSEILKGSIAQSSRLVPVVGSVTNYLVEELLNHQKKLLVREAVLLTEQEQDILFVLQTAAQHKHLLLTINHPDAWDEYSWSLSGLILPLFGVMPGQRFDSQSRTGQPCREHKETQLHSSLLCGVKAPNLC